jgi:hypothetical protein
MDFLGTLVPPPRRASYGAALKLAVFDPDTLDANTTPPAFYALLKGKGFLTWDEAVVSELSRRGFSAFRHEVTPAEGTWLASNANGWVAAGKPGLLYFVTCPGEATLDVQGLPVCGGPPIPGMIEVAPKPGSNPCSIESLPESIEGEIRAGQLEAAKRLAPPGATVCYRYFGGNPTVSDAQKVRARDTILAYDGLLRTVEQTEAQRKISGRAFTPGQQNAINAARSFLATYAQPVEKARPFLFPSGSPNRRRPVRGPTRAPFGGAPLVLAAVVVIVLAIATYQASTAWLAESKMLEQANQQRKDIFNAMLPTIQELTACAQDVNRSPAQRQSCVDQLKNLGDLAGNVVPDAGGGTTDWAQLAKYGVIGVGIVAGVYLVGPAVRAASTSTAASLAVGEQKSLQRRKMIRELSR